MENFALIALVEQLKTVTRGMVVRRVVQHHPNGFLLQTRTVKIPALKISLNARNPVIYVSGERPPVQAVTTDFLMILRKHLNSAQLLEVEKSLSERIVELKFKTALPAPELETVFLVAELLPNSPNLFLLDRARRVLGSVVAPGPQRGIDEYGEYSYPNTNKTDLTLTREEDPSWFVETDFDKDPKNWLIRNIAGIGPIFAAEILQRKATSEGGLPDLIRDLVDQLLGPVSTAWVYAEKPFGAILEQNDVQALQKVIISPIELESLTNTHGAQTYPGMLEATRIVSEELESRTLLQKAKSPRMKRIRDRMRRLSQQHQRLLDRQQQYSEAGEFKTRAQMLVASGADMDRHHESVEVIDYFGDGPEPRTIELDPSKTLRENVNKMFKKHHKAERGMGMVRRQLSELEVAQAQLQAQADRIGSIGTWDAWGAMNPPADKQQSTASGTPGARPGPRRRRSVELDGHEVLVGRNSRENDELTFKVATGDDFWFHVADYTGSHVIVRNPARDSELEEAILVRAAQLAAYYSQARNSNKVEVHYTQRKFVSKPKKAKPGLVRLREFKTVTVEPHNWSQAKVTEDS